jgi:hypothetical protein
MCSVAGRCSRPAARYHGPQRPQRESRRTTPGTVELLASFMAYDVNFAGGGFYIG